MLGATRVARVGLVRRAATLRAASSKASTPLLETSQDDGVLTIRFANEKKLNAWTHPLMLGLFEQLKFAAESPDVKGVVVTGNGKYYSAGVDLSATIQPMMPATLIKSLRDQNQCAAPAARLRRARSANFVRRSPAGTFSTSS